MPAQHVYARVTGLGYLIIIATGLFAEFFVRSTLMVPGDATATAGNIMASGSLYRWGLMAEFAMLVSDVVVALALYVVFRGVSKRLAMLAAFFRLTHASIVGLNLLNTYVPLLLLGGAPYLNVFDAGQLHALVMLFLEAHSYGYVIGLVFFAVHCGLLAHLVLKSGYLPKVIGGLLALAAVGYLVDSAGRTLMPHYDLYEAAFTAGVFIPAFVGELSFCLWMLVKGVKAT